ncbi:TPA: hypothetical protein ACX6QX_000596 [Photobacterium damselae]
MFSGYVIAENIDQVNLLNDNKKQLLDIKNELTLIKGKSLETNEKIKTLEKNASEIDYYNLFFVPIFISCLVWLFTTYIPEKRRTKKFRFKIELNLFKISGQLNAIFHNVMHYHEHQTQSSLTYQNELISPDISFDDFKVGLQNKTYNSNNYDKETNRILHPIGKNLLFASNNLNSRIQELYILSDHLSPSEIMMIDNINSALNKYGIESTLGNDISYIVDPSLTHMASTMVELHLNYQKIYNIIYKNDEIKDENFILSVTRWLYFNKRYKECLKYIKNKRTLSELKSRECYLDMFVFKCLYKIGLKSKGLDVLKETLLKIDNIEQYSDFEFIDFIFNEDVKSIFIDVYNKEVYDLLYMKANKYIIAKENHKLQAKQISKHFKLKLDNNKLK